MKTHFTKPLLCKVAMFLCLILVALVTTGCEDIKYYTVNFVGEEVSVESQSIEYGMRATKPENPEREGYNFGGWFTDNGTFAKEWNFKADIVTQDTTLYAKWEEINLQGTKWKLIGIVETEILIELEPKDCAECYTLTFDTNDTFEGRTTSNIIMGNYEIDYNTQTLRFTNIGGTEVGEVGDGYKYAEILWKIQSFILKKDVHPSMLYLYYNENRNYLLFKLLE